jgi:hypothetical protein
MPIKKPTNLDSKFWKANLPKGVVVDAKTPTYLEFAHVHIVSYSRRDLKSTDQAVMRDRINDLRQLSAGIKKSAAAINAALKDPKNKKNEDGVAFLYAYLEVLRAAERDRQNLISKEKAAGNTKAIDEILKGDSVIRI